MDKVSKVPGIDGNRARNPLIQSQGFNPIYHDTSTLRHVRCDRGISERKALATKNSQVIETIICVGIHL